MHEIIIVTNDEENFSSFVQALSAESEYVIGWDNSLEQSQERVSAAPPALMVIDEKIDGVSNLQIARQIVMKNPMINLALVSSLSAKDFHEASEGLGILTHLPRHPGKEDALKLAKLIDKIF